MGDPRVVVGWEYCRGDVVLLRVNRALCALRNLSMSIARLRFCGGIDCGEICFSFGVVVFAVGGGDTVLGCGFCFGTAIVIIICELYCPKYIHSCLHVELSILLWM